ncbi:type VII secretion system-associated protein [Streptomyces sp. NPDC058548]|uniref:type VII secretion system-associated protein n=1 Tax=unclassified Streptomyces TaxID=2593676 RepID=UPI003650F776
MADTQQRPEPTRKAEPDQDQDPDQDRDPEVGLDHVPDYIRMAARMAPDQWVTLVDPTWQGEGAPPRWAMIGEWRSDTEGELAEFRENEEYRPSPLAHEWPDPTDPVDAAVQLAATGYGPPEDVYRALATRPFAVAEGDEDGAIGLVDVPDRGPMVLAFSSPAQVTAAGDPKYGLIHAAELLELLPDGHGILLNSGGPVGMGLKTDELRAALADAADAEPTATPESGSEPAPEPEPDGEPESGPTPTPTPASVHPPAPDAGAVPGGEEEPGGDEEPGHHRVPDITEVLVGVRPRPDGATAEPASPASA